MRKYMIGIVVGVLLASVVVVLAGNLDSPAAPGATSSYSLKDIYNRLNAGTAGSQSTFTEPGAGPGSTMHTLNDLMAEAPALDNTNGATTAEVLTGKTYWSLRTLGGTWGPQTGTAAAGSDVSGPDGSKTFSIPDGFYSSKTATANDLDLVAGNIKSGVTILGVDGERHGGCTCCSTCTLHESRWCDNGNGTVTDLTTCLVWLKKADWGGAKKWEDCTGHDDAHTRAGILRAADYAWLSDGSVEGDWRLPTKTELVGLVNGTPNLRCSWPGPCDLYAFTGVQSPYYWSSTTYASSTSYAWLVSLASGGVYNASKSNTFYVWPVRGGQ